MKYYDGNKLLMQARPFCFCVGSRSAGKSFYFKKRLISEFLKTGNQFIYVRRYKTDLDLVLPTFFDDVQHKFPKDELEVRKNEFYINGELAGWAIPVSLFTKYKSVNFNHVRYIMFDEFLPEDGRYIGGKGKPYLEPELCFSFYQSVARGYNKPIREEVQFIFIANAVTRLNPYFIYFGIDRYLVEDIKFLKKDSFALEITQNSEVNEEIKQSRFGLAINGTSYGEYAINNGFYLDNSNFIENPDKDMKYSFNFIIDGNMYSVWNKVYEDVLYVSDKVDRQHPRCYAITNADHSTNTIGYEGIKYQIPVMKMLYSYGGVRFRNHRSKYAFEILIGVR